MTHTTRDKGRHLPESDALLVREREILGSQPRISPLQVEDINGDLLAMVQGMIAVNQAIGARRKEELTDLMSDTTPGTIAEDMQPKLANLPEIMRTMLRHPQLFARQTELGVQLLGNGALNPRDRELAVLRIGWLCQAPYEWGEHVHIAKDVGLSSEEIERITRGSDAAGWNELDRCILKAVEELYDNAMISDATWRVLEQHLDDRQLIELPIVVGQYQTVSYYQNSLRLRLHDGNSGLRAR